jgi:hypothetical protein
LRVRTSCRAVDLVENIQRSSAANEPGSSATSSCHRGRIENGGSISAVQNLVQALDSGF